MYNSHDLAQIGGREMYIQGMLNHQRRMANIKPAVRSEAPKAPFCGGTRRTPRPQVRPSHANEEYTEVREAFKRILLAKPVVQNQMPAWKIEMGERLTRNRKLNNNDQFARMEHARSLLNMHERIAHAGSLSERKKNKLDPALYPALRMRRSASTPPGELWRAAAAKRATGSPSSTPRSGVSGVGRPRTAGPVVAARPSSARRRPAQSEAPPRAVRPQRLQRPHSARPSRTGPAEALPTEGAVPDAGLGQPKNEYGALRELLLQRIVEARLYREADLRRFLAQVLRENRQLDHTRLQAVVRDVEREFFLVG